MIKSLFAGLVVVVLALTTTKKVSVKFAVGFIVFSLLGLLFTAYYANHSFSITYPNFWSFEYNNNFILMGHWGSILSVAAGLLFLCKSLYQACTLNKAKHV